MRREKLPGRYFELNIYEGLFLGGSGDSLDLFLGHFDWLRGCLSAVFYNGVDVLKRARYRTFQSDVHGVTWSCASEFDASFTNDMSFMEEGAFMSMPNPVSRTGVRYEINTECLSNSRAPAYRLYYLHLDGNLKSKLSSRIAYYSTIRNWYKADVTIT